MKKLFLGISLICLLLALFTPLLIKADEPLVPCDGVNVKCTWDSIKVMLERILSFIIWKMAIPLSVLALTVGGIIMLTSAGNPGMATLGKKIVYSAIIGVFLSLCSVLIINFVLNAIGYSDTVEMPTEPPTDPTDTPFEP